MPRLSIIIPYWGNACLLEDTLVSVLENRPEESEVLVVLQQPYDDPYDLGDEVRFVDAPPLAGRIATLNVGISHCRAPIVHLIECGTQVSAGWAEDAIECFDDPEVASVAPLVLGADRPGCVLAVGLEYRPGGRIRVCREAAEVAGLSRASVLAPHTAAAFYRRSALELVGYLSAEAGDRLAGVDLALKLAYMGWHTALATGCQVTAMPGHEIHCGALRAGLDTERLFWRWADHGGWLRSLWVHGMVVSGECLTSLTSPRAALGLTGRLLGCFRMGAHRRRDMELRPQVSPASHAAAPINPPHFLRRPAATPRQAGSRV